MSYLISISSSHKNVFELKQIEAHKNVFQLKQIEGLVHKLHQAASNFSGSSYLHYVAHITQRKILGSSP